MRATLALWTLAALTHAVTGQTAPISLKLESYIKSPERGSADLLGIGGVMGMHRYPDGSVILVTRVRKRGRCCSMWGVGVWFFGRWCTLPPRRRTRYAHRSPHLHSKGNLRASKAKIAWIPILQWFIDGIPLDCGLLSKNWSHR